jgi:outer membrane receptor protein involved in Fe transport
VRASYNLSITRPAVGSLLPTTNVNEDTRIITTGNPQLRPYTSDNFEVAVQRYFEPIGLLEVSAFLKEISNYTRTIDGVVPEGADNGFEGQFTGFTLRRQQNTGGARIRGVEVSYQQQYTFLPGPWRGLGSFAKIFKVKKTGFIGPLFAFFHPAIGGDCSVHYGHASTGVLDFRLFGKSPDKYHAVNVVHSSNSFNLA